MRDGHAVLPDAESLDITGTQLTLEAWVWPAPTRSHSPIIAKGDTQYALKVTGDGQLEFFIYEKTWIPVRAPLPADWTEGRHHVAGVYDGREMRLYVNGALDASKPLEGGATTNDYPVLIGENAQQTGRFWNGLIDDVRIYNYALREADIQRLYAGD